LILADVDRFLAMTEELLDFSRGTVNFEPREVHLGDWLDSLVISVLGSLSAPGIQDPRIQLETQFDYRGWVNIDSERLRRAVSNIVANAIDAMPGGGIFTVRTKLGGSCWEMELEDTGIGIPAEIRPKILEPFVSFGKEHGTGLGLAVVRNIVEGQGGEIQFQSRVAGEVPGQEPGTRFVIRMPVVSVEAGQP